MLVAVRYNVTNALDCNNNGIPDDCESDRDLDGIIDACDGCPDDYHKSWPGVCGCGESDADYDGDGVAQCFDRCPGIDDNLDEDGNGIPDCLDVIPTISEWGIIIMTLLLLVLGKLYFGHARESESSAPTV